MGNNRISIVNLSGENCADGIVPALPTDTSMLALFVSPAAALCGLKRIGTAYVSGATVEGDYSSEEAAVYENITLPTRERYSSMALTITYD
jgi:hypothetical protein